MKCLSVPCSVGYLSALAWVMPLGAQSTPPTVYLEPQPATNNPPFQTWIAGARYGEVNFLDRYVSGGQFQKFFRPLNPDDPPMPPACTGTAVKYALPIGDRLGYDTAALFDVNGDKFNDWAETWYHAEPVSALGNANDPDSFRAFDNDSIMPGGSTVTNTPAGLRNTSLAQPMERVGVCRMVSGVQPLMQNGNPVNPGPGWGGTLFLGQGLWGNADDARLAHEIASIKDIDGDGLGEMILSSNGTDGACGSINVYSYTNLYNTQTGDTLKRWVCIWRIVGDTPYASELAYELEDNQIDFNNDGQVDIMAASGWWREDTGDRNGACLTTQRGGGWVFLTPPQSLFQQIQQSATWGSLPGDSAVKAPLVMYEEHASLVVHNPVVTSGCGPGVVADLGSAGDMDADGKPDFVVNAGFDDGADHRRGMYFYLSSDGYNDQTGQTMWSWTTKQKYRQLNAAGNAPEPNASFEQMNLVPNQADLVIRGNAQWDFHSTTGSVTGMDFDNASPTAPGQPDLVLMLLQPPNYSTGRVIMMMNMPGRFGAGINGSPLGTLAADVFGPGSQPDGLPKQYGYGTPLFQASTDYEIISRFGPNDPPSPTCNSLDDTSTIVGVNIAGNFDGVGYRDCELAFNLVRYAYQANPPYNRGDSVVLAFPAPTGGMTPPAPTQLMRIVGENNKMVLNSAFMLNNEEMDVQPCGGTGFYRKIADEGVGVNQMGCIPEPAWDQDGDGRDDLIIRAPFFPKRVNTVPTCNPASPSCGQTADIPPSGLDDSPYFVDGGADYLILSPPAQPELVGSSPWSYVDTDNNGVLDVARVTITAKALVPSKHPYNWFWPEDVRVVGNTCNGSCPPPAYQCTATGIVLRAKDSPVQGMDTVTVEFPYNSVTYFKTPCIRFNTRWRGGSFPGQDFAFCVCPPKASVTTIEE